MIKDNIMLYDGSRLPLSLKLLPLQPECENRIEYIFYTLNIARDFDDLTDLLGRVLACSFEEVCRSDHYILYEVQFSDERYCLKFRIKPNSVQQAA